MLDPPAHDAARAVAPRRRVAHARREARLIGGHHEAGTGDRDDGVAGHAPRRARRPPARTRHEEPARSTQSALTEPCPLIDIQPDGFAAAAELSRSAVALVFSDRRRPRPASHAFGAAWARSETWSFGGSPRRSSPVFGSVQAVRSARSRATARSSSASRSRSLRSGNARAGRMGAPAKKASIAGRRRARRSPSPPATARIARSRSYLLGPRARSRARRRASQRTRVLVVEHRSRMRRGVRRRSTISWVATIPTRRGAGCP